MKKLILASLCALMLNGCAAPYRDTDLKAFPRFHLTQTTQYEQVHQLKPLPMRKRLAWPKVKPDLPAQTNENVYSFVAKKIPLRQALRLFARAYQLNILMDQDIQGNVDVEFHELPFGQAMTALLGSLGYYWQYDKDLIRVRAIQTKLFNIDYIRLTRTGAGSSEAQISSGSSNSSSGSDSGGSGGSQAGKISIEQENKIEFWNELEKQLKQLISEKGRLVINRIAGTVQVTDNYPRVVEISRYIHDIQDSIKRQVNIEIKILEVTLNDDSSLGIDWSRLVSRGQTGGQLDFNIQNIISSPVGTGIALPATIDLTASQTDNSGSNKLTALITALEQQGEVQIVSQPHIRTMNNQSALIKVGTDRTFFRREQSTDNTTAGSTTSTSDVPQVVTEGIVLSITPQISRQGWIMMDISPVITRVSSVSEVKDAAGNIQSSAPNLDIRQTSSLVRVFNGETVIIGGLIQTQDAKTGRGVPGLDSLPGVGGLFRGKYHSVIKKELIIFLTPKLVEDKPSNLNK